MDRNGSNGFAGRLRQSLIVAAALAPALVSSPEGAHAQMLMAPSPGCAAANAGAYDSTSGSSTVPNTFANIFTAGETLTFTTLGFVVTSSATDNTAGVTILAPAFGNRTADLFAQRRHCAGPRQ